MTRFITFLLAVILATSATAHSKIDATTPKDGAELSQVPVQIELGFSKNLRLTKVEMIHNEHPSVPLELGAQKQFDTKFTLPLEDMGTGTYRIEWRGLGEDGHAMRGEFMFMVD